MLFMFYLFSNSRLYFKIPYLIINWNQFIRICTFLSFFHFVNNVYKFKTYVWLLYHLFQKDNVLSLTKIKVCNRWFEHIWMHCKGLKVRQHENTLIHYFVKTTIFFFLKRSEIRNKNSTKWNHQDRVVKWFGREETH